MRHASSTEWRRREFFELFIFERGDHRPCGLDAWGGISREPGHTPAISVKIREKLKLRELFRVKEVEDRVRRWRGVGNHSTHWRLFSFR